jgi:hypothetical protein
VDFRETINKFNAPLLLLCFGLVLVIVISQLVTIDRLGDLSNQVSNMELPAPIPYTNTLLAEGVFAVRSPFSTNPMTGTITITGTQAMVVPADNVTSSDNAFGWIKDAIIPITVVLISATATFFGLRMQIKSSSEALEQQIESASLNLNQEIKSTSRRTIWTSFVESKSFSDDLMTLLSLVLEQTKDAEQEAHLNKIDISDHPSLLFLYALKPELEQAINDNQPDKARRYITEVFKELLSLEKENNNE